MPLNPVSSSLDISHENLLYSLGSESEARRLYWAGRLRVSIDWLLMKNHQSQLDLVVLPPSHPTPYPPLQHRSRSLFNILQDDGPPAQQFVAKEDGQLFAMEPKRSRPPQPTKKKKEFDFMISGQMPMRRTSSTNNLASLNLCAKKNRPIVCVSECRETASARTSAM
ncbi:hypothetical protein GHT06_010693 [Daphnia sinensis]|uniref:Uncharacterized protein n=1 Tax=Daphnia sinensis TaxID=1820382 RepID=A0AAD5Q1F6_9CRUS|nr:hypothetical protein GHT06_010693 [Daphnia sinensis]